MGDGVLIYFGYPNAQEKDAERAVRAGLAILDGIPALNAKIVGDKGARVAVRIGVATGIVVVGETVGMAPRRSVRSSARRRISPPVCRALPVQMRY